MPAQLPGGRVALSRTLLGLGRHRGRPPGGRDAVVGVGRQRRGVHEDVRLVHEAVLVHEPDAVVVRRAPDPRVRRHGQVELTSDLEGGAFRKGRVAGDVEGELPAVEVAAAALEEGPHRRVGSPLPRPGLDVAVRQHEPARHALQGVDGRFSVVDRLQAVRPVDRRGHPCLECVPGRQEVAGVHVLRAEPAAVLEVVPDEVLGEGPVGAVPAHRRLPHVPVGVDHAGHDDAAGGVDLEDPVGAGEPVPHLRDAVADDEHVAAGQHAVVVVHRQHRGVPEQHRTAGGHLVVSHDLLPFFTLGQVSAWWHPCVVDPLSARPRGAVKTLMADPRARMADA